MHSARYFRWLPNALTASRMALSVPIFWAAVDGAWALGFWLLIIALVTDFFDGLAARKLNARTVFGEQFDPLADSSLVVAGMVGLSVTGHVSWLLTATVLLFGLLVGNPWFLRAHGKSGAVAQKIASVACLFMAWIGITWFFASLAFGWEWWYVLATLAVLVTSAALKKHRLRTWLGRV